MIEFRTIADWKKHVSQVGPTRSTYQECVWREHGGPGEAIQWLQEKKLPVTLDAILEECEHYDRQEQADDPFLFWDGEYMRDKVLVSLLKLIEAGLVWTVKVEN